MANMRLFKRIKEKHPQLYRIEISKPNIYVLYKIIHNIFVYKIP